MAAIWSAVAATCAAMAAFMMVLIHRRNLLEASKPELALDGWRRFTRGEGDAAQEVIAFNKVRNVGRGPAFHVQVRCMHNWNNYRLALVSNGASRIAIIPAGEAATPAWEIIVSWKNVERIPDQKWPDTLPLSVEVWSWDSRGIRHITTYKLFAHRHHITTDEGYGPGVRFETRTTVSRPVWLLEWKDKPRRVARRLARRFRARKTPPPSPSTVACAGKGANGEEAHE